MLRAAAVPSARRAQRWARASPLLPRRPLRVCADGRGGNAAIRAAQEEGEGVEGASNRWNLAHKGNNGSYARSRPCRGLEHVFRELGGADASEGGALNGDGRAHERAPRMRGPLPVAAPAVTTAAALPTCALGGRLPGGLAAQRWPLAARRRCRVRGRGREARHHGGFLSTSSLTHTLQQQALLSSKTRVFTAANAWQQHPSKRFRAAGPGSPAAPRPPARQSPWQWWPCPGRCRRQRAAWGEQWGCGGSNGVPRSPPPSLALIRSHTLPVSTSKREKRRLGALHCGQR